MTTRIGRHVAAAAVAYLLMTPSEASAKFFLITSGDTITDLGSGKDTKGTVKVGYKYSYGGIFWIDLWTWDGTYCIYEDKRFQPISESQAAALLGKPPSTPFLYRFPLGLLIIGGFAVLGVIGAVTKSGGPKPDADGTGSGT